MREKKKQKRRETVRYCDDMTLKKNNTPNKFQSGIKKKEKKKKKRDNLHQNISASSCRSVLFFSCSVTSLCFRFPHFVSFPHFVLFFHIHTNNEYIVCTIRPPSPQSDGFQIHSFVAFFFVSLFIQQKRTGTQKRRNRQVLYFAVFFSSKYACFSASVKPPAGASTWDRAGFLVTSINTFACVVDKDSAGGPAVFFKP